MTGITRGGRTPTKMPMMNLPVLLLPLLLTVLSATRGDDICTDNPIDDKQHDFDVKLLDDFSVNIEVVKADGVENAKMYYSRERNITRVDYLTNTTSTSIYIYFVDNEVLFFDFTTGRGTCTVANKLADIVDPFLFGGIKPKKQQSIPTPLEVFHFQGRSGFGDHDIFNEYKGTADIRGKPAIVFSSCQKWSSELDGIVVQVSHYFADTTNERWNYPIIDKNVSPLLAMSVKGTGRVNDKPNTQIDYTYNYFNFKRLEDLSVLETPDGVACLGRKLDKKMPQLPKYIRFTSETIDYSHTMDAMLTVDEMYDFSRNFVILRHSLFPTTDKDMGRLTEVYDLVKGELYRLDNKLNLCKKTLITDTDSTAFITTQNGKPALISPNAFFKADSKNFAYLGQKKVRGMMTDTWVADSKDFPDSPEATVQWHFAPPGTQSWNDRNKNYNKNKWPIPVRFIKYSDGHTKSGIVQNIYHVDYNPMRPDYIDLSLCFNQKRHFQLVIKASQRSIEQIDLEAFKYEILTQVAEVAKVGQFQVNQMKTYYTGGDTLVEFYIGDDKRLEEITRLVTEAIQNKKFAFNVMYKDRPKVFPEVSASSALVETKVTRLAAPADEGYTAGAMGGLGIAMAVLGLFGGVAAAFAHTRYM